MIKYRGLDIVKPGNESNQFSNMPTPRLITLDLKNSGLDDAEEVNQTIPRLNHPNINEFLSYEFKSQNKLTDVSSDTIQRYKHEIEALNIENASLKKALHQARANSIGAPSSPSKIGLRRTVTSMKMGMCI